MRLSFLFVALFAMLLATFLLLGCTAKPPATIPQPSQPQIAENDTAPIVEQNDTPAPDEVPVPPAEENRSSVKYGKEGEFCGGIAANIFQCEPGLECMLDGSYPDAGGTCQKPSVKDNTFYTCPSARNQACTKEYIPVCGRLVGAEPEVAGYRDFGNACDACSVWTNAIGYYKGTCESRNAR